LTCATPLYNGDTASWVSPATWAAYSGASQRAADAARFIVQRAGLGLASSICSRRLAADIFGLDSRDERRFNHLRDRGEILDRVERQRQSFKGEAQTLYIAARNRRTLLGHLCLVTVEQHRRPFQRARPKKLLGIYAGGGVVPM
jgi:hypothetical protein